MTNLSWISIIPPVIVVILAIKTKNIIFSLFTGVTSSLALLVFLAPSDMTGGHNPIDMIEYGLRLMIKFVGSEENLMLIFFLCMIGGIIAILTASGCANSFSDTITKTIKTKKKAEFMTFMMGCLIFIDDYFNAITVGNMMVTITDKLKISRAKLAYLIDSTSAPVTVLMPVSSWVATIISLMLPELTANGFEISGMQAFLGATAFNLYAWLTLFMVVVVIVFDINLGKMKYFEDVVEKSGIDDSIFVDINESVIDDIGEDHKGTTWNMVVILIFLIFGTIMMMLYTGDILDPGTSISEAFINCDPNISLATSSVVTVILAFVIFVLTGKLNLSKFSDAFTHGIKSMVVPIVILILSWTFSALLGTAGLRTGEFISLIFNKIIPGWLLPVLVFAIAALISFSTGASWGAMAITIPTSITLCTAVGPEYINMVLGATMAGSVFGDHCSPLADTTVMSSSGAGCKHLDHVVSQLPYAMIVAIVSALGFLILGLTGLGWTAYAFGIAVILLIGLFAGRIEGAAAHIITKRSSHVQDSNM